uniref:Uncharacterized protein n=1 Tax=Meloidogyne enterolobii TaxID=390850 RepID=A0A6V7WDY8_MELEN|nr:unnamed protein product [Meloidogyne enterolobii]
MLNIQGIVFKCFNTIPILLNNYNFSTSTFDKVTTKHHIRLSSNHPSTSNTTRNNPRTNPEPTRHNCRLFK